MSESIFPFLGYDEVAPEEDFIDGEPPLAKEYALDFATNEFLTKNGKMYIVDKNEALKIWIYKILKTERFEWLVYDHDYGSDVFNYLGMTEIAYTKAEIERAIKEALLATLGAYIKEIQSFDIDLVDNTVEINFQIATIYDEEWLDFAITLG